MFTSLFRKVVGARSRVVVDRILPYMKMSKKIIDIGSGTGDVAFLLQQKGKDITPVDVTGFHGPRLVKTTIYGGETLPFRDNSFDTALLITVLHHTPHPEGVFDEAARVAKDIIVIETSYKTRVGKFMTVIVDTFANLQLKANWTSYKADSEWKSFFSKKGYRIVDTQHYTDHDTGIPFLHILYYLKKQ